MSKFRCFSPLRIRTVKGVSKEAEMRPLGTQKRPDLSCSTIHFWTNVSECARECRSTYISDHPRHSLSLVQPRRDILPRERHWVPDTETAVPKPKGEGASFMAEDFVSAG